MTALKLAHNAVHGQLINPPREIAAYVANLLSYIEAGSAPTFGMNIGNDNGRSSFYEFSNNTFPAGFVHLVHQSLVAKGHVVQMIRRPHHTPLGPESPIVDEFGNENPDYDFQMKALRQVEKHGRGIIQVATGGGKSKIAKLICARYRRMTLFLTTRSVLLYQMKRQLDKMGLNTGLIGDGEMKVTKGVNLGMVQTLVQALEEPEINAEIRAVVKSIHRNKSKNSEMSPEEVRVIAQKRFDDKTKRRNIIIRVLEMVEVVIGEEAHEVGGSSYYEILKYCKNASIRVALTATPFMRANAEDNMRLMAAFGSILIKVSEETLINRGILAKPFFKFMDCAPHKTLRRTSPYERAYKFGYVENPFMHAAIVRDAGMAKVCSLPVLTLVKHTAHGDVLLELMRAAGLRFEFLRGENKQKERELVLDGLASGEIDGLIGTTILDVGVDCPVIGLGQLCGGGKAEVAMRQRVGRTLRAKKDGVPNFAFIADYTCDMNTYLRDHTRERRAIIEATPGFVEGILPAGQDFDWSIFRKALAA